MKFCSDAARARGDDNAGTATRIDVWILIEHPGPWGRRPLLDASLPDAVRGTLTKALTEIPRSRIVFIRRRFESRPGCRVYIARSSPAIWTVSIDLASIDDIATLPLRALARGQERDRVTIEKTPVVLVCTHGQRDSCCGRRGYPLYDALRTQPSLDVWQCSHIGGDRFAANAVVLPWGIYYGPVEPREADALAESIQRNELLLDAYRGRSSMPRFTQAAETFLRRHTGVIDRDAYRVVLRNSLPDGRTHVHFVDGSETRHEVTIEPFLAHEEALLTCSAEATCPIVQFRLVEYRTISGA